VRSTPSQDKFPQGFGGSSVARQPAWVISASIILTLATGPTMAIAQGIGLPLRWKNEKREYGIPDTIVAVWTYAVAHTPGQPPTRGFGGRIMFYQDGREKPIKVDGTLVVYAFEETGNHEQKVIADRRYVFSPEELQRSYSQSRLGHSYSIWLPWDEAGSPQRTVSLIVCFTARQGSTVVSQQSKVSLPGPRNPIDKSEEAFASSPAGKQPQVWTVPTPVRAQARPTNPTGVESDLPSPPNPSPPTPPLSPATTQAPQAGGPQLTPPIPQGTWGFSPIPQPTIFKAVLPNGTPTSWQPARPEPTVQPASYQGPTPGTSPAGHSPPPNPLRASNSPGFGNPTGVPPAGVSPQTYHNYPERNSQQLDSAFTPALSPPQTASGNRTLWSGPGSLETPAAQRTR